MSRRGLIGLLTAVVLGFVVPAGGCGDSQSETHVKVDKEKDEMVQKAMGDYMNKQPQVKKKGE